MLRNLIVKTQCDTDVAQWQLQSFSSCMSVANLVITATATVFVYVLLLLYLSLSLSLILIPQKSAYYLTFLLDT